MMNRTYRGSAGSKLEKITRRVIRKVEMINEGDTNERKENERVA